MGVGEPGKVGVRVLLLVEEAKRPEKGCATIQSHLTVGAPVQETPPRFPDAIYTLAQVSNSVRLGQNYYWHIYNLLQIKKRSHPEPTNYKTVLSLRGRIGGKVFPSYSWCSCTPKLMAGF